MTTKKLPVPLNPKTGQPRSGKDFLIPFPPGDEMGGFLGIQSGKRHQMGMLVYLGGSIGVQEIRAKAGQFISELSDPLLNAYLAALAEFKIGNVIAVAYSEDGLFSLSKVQDMIPSEKKSKLP